MFRNYLKIAVRNLWRNKAISFINIIGLAVGLAACLVILLYIYDETSYDRHQKDGERIFRIATSSANDGDWSAESGPLAFAVKDNLPDVEQAARLMTFPDIAKMLVKYQDGSIQKQFFETNGYYVDSTFFKVLTYDFINGDGLSALDEPNSMVVSKTMANKYFSNTNPVGKILIINTPFGPFNYTVTAVFDDKIHKSHIPANYFLSMHNNDMWHWVQQQTAMTGNCVFYSYIKLKKAVSASIFEKKLNAYFDKETLAQRQAAGISIQLYLQPVKGIYLHSNAANEIGSNGNMTYLYILGTIAGFLLVIACINFMNLSTARSEKRAKEVGIRKVVGAQRNLLIGQFLGESLVMAIISLLIAVVLVQILMPLINSITQKQLNLIDHPGLLYWIILLTVVTGLFAGLYPAFYLSSFKPIAVLKGKTLRSLSATSLRKGLVVFQFTVSICLVFATIVIWTQMRYLENQQLGFNKEQKIVLPLQDGYLNGEQNYNALKDDLLRNPEINAVTSGSAYPGITNLSDILFYAEGRNKGETVDTHLNAVEANFISTLGFTLLSGRTFSKDFNDSSSIILNETALRKLNYTVNGAIGRKVQYDLGKVHGTMNVIGVVKDFNFEDLHRAIEPYAFTYTAFGNRFGNLIASVRAGNYQVLLEKMQGSWAKLNPGVPFEYSFLDQDFQKNYLKEEQTSRVVTDFTILAILIACLGLFGLSAFSAGQRTREIGIRKVLGASVPGVVRLLSKEYVLLVSIAFLIAMPIVGWAMNKWLQEFAFRIHLEWWMFTVAGMLAMMIALLTVSVQSIRAALTDPVKSLKME